MRHNCFLHIAMAFSVILGLCSTNACAEDPITMWEKLSAQQKAEVEKTLTERLPLVLGEDFGDYGKMLATEIPRWVNVSRRLEAGEYAAVLGEFEGELSDFVTQYMDEQLPQEGFARWTFDQATANADSLRKVAIDIADPTKEWSNVRDTMFSEVNRKVQARSKQVLENAVVYVINEVVGKPSASLDGYSTGELYILAVGEWQDYVATWPGLFEREAVNEMYEIYRVQRQQHDRDTAWAVVRNQWTTERVTDPQGGSRRIRSWSARMTHLSNKLKVPFDEIPDKLLAMFDEYWRTSRGQDSWEYQWDTGCHGWMQRRLQSEIESRHSELRRQAKQQIEPVRSGIKAKLEAAHRAAADELRTAIEKQLTIQQKAERDAAIRQAETLVNIMLQRNVLPTERECAEFSRTVTALNEIYDRAIATHLVLYDGLADEVTALQQQVAELGELVGRFENAAATVSGNVNAVEVAVALAEQTAQATCQSASEVASADSKDEAYERLLSAVRTSESMTPFLIDAHDLLFDAKKMLQKLQGEILNVKGDRRWKLQNVKAKLHEIDAALATLREVDQLRNAWNGLYATLHASARRQQTIGDAFKAKKSRIESLLAAHHPNHQTAAIHKTVVDYESRLACLRRNLEDWESRWKEEVFPSIDAPDPQQLQEARDLLSAHPQLLQWTAGRHELLLDGLKPIIARLDGFSQRLSDADLRASLCAAKAIVDYNKIWNKGKVPGISNPDTDDGDADLSVAAGSVTRVPSTGHDQMGDADLSAAAGAVRRVPIPETAEGGDASPTRNGGSMPQGSQQPADADLSGAAGAVTRITPRSGSGTTRNTDPPPVRPEPTRPRPPMRDETQTIEPFYAVYKMYPAAPMPKFSEPDTLGKMRRWLSQLNANTINISNQPNGEFSFLVSGRLLDDYARHLEKVRNNGTQAEHPLFRKGHRYHQIGVLNTSDGHRLPYPVLLAYSHATKERPGSLVPIPIKPLDGNWATKLQLTDPEKPGAWSVADGNGNQLSMGPLTYSGEMQWSVAARAAVAEFMKQFGLGFMRQ